LFDLFMAPFSSRLEPPQNSGRFRHIALDGTKIDANASKQKALSWAHANKIEAQLREEVQGLLALAETSDRASAPDGMDVPAEIARREDRLRAIAQAKAKIAQRAAERFKTEQQEFEAKQAKRQAQRDAGKKPRGKDPEPPQAGPRGRDQVNLTDEESRIMPVSGGGFEQSYNAQAGVDTQTMLVITRHVSQAPNDKREVVPTLEQIVALPAVLGEVHSLIADNGYCSQAYVIACGDAGVEPLLALKRPSHHTPVMERFKCLCTRSCWGTFRELSGELRGAWGLLSLYAAPLDAHAYPCRLGSSPISHPTASNTKPNPFGWAFCFLAYASSAAVCRAMTPSSSVGRAKAGMGLSPWVMQVWPAALDRGSRRRPSQDRALHTSCRTRALWVPMPPVKTKASRPPMSAASAPM
jgi:hypothetical protein